MILLFRVLGLFRVRLFFGLLLPLSSVWASLSPHLFVDFELTPDLTPLVSEVRDIMALYNRDVSKADQRVEELLARLPTDTPPSLRRQLLSLLCGDERPAHEVQRFKKIVDATFKQIAAPDALDQTLHHMCDASFQFANNRYEEGFQSLYEAERILAKQPNPLYQIDLLIVRAYWIGSLGDAQASTELLLKAIAIAKQEQLPEKIPFAELYLAHNYSVTNQADVARDIYQRFLQHAEQHQHTSNLPLLYHSLAAVCDRQNEAQCDQQLLNKGLAVAQQNHDEVAEVYLLLAMATLHAEQRDWASVDRTSLQAEHMAEKLQIDDLLWRARIYRAMIAMENRQYRDSEKWLNGAYKYFEIGNSIFDLVMINGLQIELAKREEQYKKALDLHEVSIKIYRRMFERNNSVALARLRADYDLQRISQEAEALKAENAQNEQQLQQTQQAHRAQIGFTIVSILLLLVVALVGYQQWRMMRRMRDLALTDELTKLPNRRHITSFGELLFAQSKSLQQYFAVILFDIDHFKRINDSLGHAAGDAVLQQLAESVRSIGRANDRLGRTGGEEFLMIMSAASRETARLMAERIRTQIEHTDFSAIAPQLVVTVSVGVSVYDAQDKSLAQLIERADIALYRAKQSGRNRVEVEWSGGD